jgi:hypothetical protein
MLYSVRYVDKYERQFGKYYKEEVVAYYNKLSYNILSLFYGVWGLALSQSR